MKRFALLVAAAMIALPMTALGDPNIGSLRGSVVADYGDRTVPLKDARIRLTSNLGEFTTQSDRSGSYIVFGISPGRYVLSVQRHGFSPVSERVCVRAGQDQTNDLRLHSFHIDFAYMPKLAPLNSLQPQVNQTSDAYSLGACS